MLSNPVRRRILDAVKAAPGLHLRALAREVDLTWGRLLYHLDVLERARLVALRDSGRYRLVYAAGDAPPRGAATRVIHPLAQKILTAVEDSATMKATDLQESLGVSRQRLAYHLRSLEESGRISVESTPRGLVLQAPAGGESALK